MTNTRLLKSRIIECGFSIRTLAEALGWNYQSLYNRLNNLTEFKASEIEQISSVLNIRDKDLYFFNHN